MGEYEWSGVIGFL